MVPANSASEPTSTQTQTQAKNDNDDANASATATATSTTTPTTNATPTPTTPPSGSSKPAQMPEKIGGPTPSPPPIGDGGNSKGPRVKGVECKKVFDRYVDILIGSDPQFAGVPKDVLKQALTQSSPQEKNPCDDKGITKAQWKCAMKATTTDEWQTCVK
jgi:hypothetical protein